MGEGDESHEGNEEGDEGNESDEGNEEGNEEACHEEGRRGRGPDEEARNESDEGHEGHEEVIAQYGPPRQSAEMIGHGGVPRRALYTVPVLENIQSSALC